jgi:hypothetical protein
MSASKQLRSIKQRACTALLDGLIDTLPDTRAALIRRDRRTRS